MGSNGPKYIQNDLYELTVGLNKRKSAQMSLIKPR